MLLRQFHGVSGPKRGASHGGTELCVGNSQKTIGSNILHVQGNGLFFCQERQHTISRHDPQMRKALLCEIRVAITLWQLRTNDSYRTVGHLFSVSCSSVCLIVKEGCQSKRLALCNVIETSRPRVPIHEPQRRLSRKGT